jgi:hypothetical protein
MNLDPILGPALQLEQLPVVPSRKDMVAVAEQLAGCVERITSKAAIEHDATAAGQLGNAANALSVIIISLVAYTRGRSPKVASRKPDTNIIVGG